MNARGILASALLLVAATTATLAQSQIVPNPKAVQLHRVWTRTGTSNGREGWGAQAIGFPSIDNDSISEFGVYVSNVHQWKFYRGRSSKPDTIPSFTTDSVGRLAVGDFYNSGKQMFASLHGWADSSSGTTLYYSRVEVFKVDSTGIVGPAIAVSRADQCFGGLQAINIDGVAGDELVILPGCSQGDIAIYKGGSDFQLDTPTVVIHDTEKSDNGYFTVRLADFNHDGRMDMLIGGLYKDGAKLKFYWGDENSPWSWATRPPDRVILQTNGIIGVNVPPEMADLDGDGSMDLFGIVYNGPTRGTYVYLTGSGKSARTRSFTLDDADVTLLTSTAQGAYSLGYLNDSTRRYAMLAIGGFMGFSGGPHGPDSSYDAVYSTSSDGLPDDPFSQFSTPVRDVTGDGWDDYLAASPFYGSGGDPHVDAGIAIVIAGGPQIPRDFISSVQEVSVEGHSNGLSLWPNPARDELNIAWRGDLHRMPSRFEVHDLTGRLIASGSVEPYLGAALWKCADVAAGTYLLTAFDRNGAVIAHATVIKQ